MGLDCDCVLHWARLGMAGAGGGVGLVEEGKCEKLCDRMAKALEIGMRCQALHEILKIKNLITLFRILIRFSFFGCRPECGDWHAAFDRSVLRPNDGKATLPPALHPTPPPSSDSSNGPMQAARNHGATPADDA